MSEIPPIRHPMQPLPQDKKLKEDGKQRRQDRRERPRPQPPAPDDSSHIDEYA